MTAAAALFLSALLFAQTFTGGIKGTVVSRAGRVPVSGAEMVLSQDGRQLAEITSGSEGARSSSRIWPTASTNSASRQTNSPILRCS